MGKKWTKKLDEEQHKVGDNKAGARLWKLHQKADVDASFVTLIFFTFNLLSLTVSSLR